MNSNVILLIRMLNKTPESYTVSYHILNIVLFKKRKKRWGSCFALRVDS